MKRLDGITHNPNEKDPKYTHKPKESISPTYGVTWKTIQKDPKSIHDAPKAIHPTYVGGGYVAVGAMAETVDDMCVCGHEWVEHRNAALDPFCGAYKCDCGYYEAREAQGNEYWLKSWECVMGHASNDGGSEEEVESAHAVFLDRDDMPDLVTSVSKLIASEVRKARRAEIDAISDLLAGKLSINSADVVSSALIARIVKLEGDKE